jgi:hypothetical protein
MEKTSHRKLKATTQILNEYIRQVEEPGFKPRTPYFKGYALYY